MNSEDDEEQRKRHPFDRFRKDEFDRVFREIERMLRNDINEISSEKLPPGKSFVRGFNVNIGPDGQPRIQEFGNFPKKISKGKTIISEEREPIVDIIENHANVAITVELPGIEKEDIDLDVVDQTLEIMVNHPNRKYHKIVELPCDVKPKTTTATYKNGVLDIEIEKKHKGSSKNGYKVNIK